MVCVKPASQSRANTFVDYVEVMTAETITRARCIVRCHFVRVTRIAYWLTLPVDVGSYGQSDSEGEREYAAAQGLLRPYGRPPGTTLADYLVGRHRRHRSVLAHP